MNRFLIDCSEFGQLIELVFNWLRFTTHLEKSDGLTDEISDHAVSREHAELDLIPVEPIPREKIHHCHFT